MPLPSELDAGMQGTRKRLLCILYFVDVLHSRLQLAGETVALKGCPAHQHPQTATSKGLFHSTSIRAEAEATAKPPTVPPTAANLQTSAMVTSTSTPGSMLMLVICLTTSAGECRSMRRLWIL